jgi:hypothetical protein
MIMPTKRAPEDLALADQIKIHAKQAVGNCSRCQEYCDAWDECCPRGKVDAPGAPGSDVIAWAKEVLGE